MITANIHDAKTNLSKYLKKVQKGETVILCKHNVPIAEIRPIQKEKPKKERPLGLAKGQITIPDSFFDPMTQEELDAFYAPIKL